MSVSFGIFAFAVVLTYFLFPVKKYQWTILLIASYLFYAFSSPKGFLYILFTTLSTFGAALWIQKKRKMPKLS